MTFGRRFVALATAAVLVLTACTSGGGGGSGDKTKVRLQLQWFPQAQFAGYFAAKDKGFYSDEGLDVEIKPGAVEIVPATVVAGGQAEFGISWVPRMLAPRESGADVQLIGQIFQRSPTLQVSFKDKNITKPEDFKGKKIGSWGFGNEAELFAGMRKAGIDPDNPSDVSIVPQQFDMNAFVAGDIDAAQAMIYNEYAQVLETKNPATGELFKPEDLNVVSWEEYGTAMLQDAIFTSESWLAKPGNEDIAVKFLKASFKGWAYCRDNVDECVQIVLKSDAKLPKGHQTWQMNEVNGIIWPAPNGIGIMDQAAFDRTVDIAVAGKILKAKPTGTPFRNDLAQKALDALGTAVDTKGANFQKQTVTLTEGGQ
jgi:NitT/TauT family transport system substrate-binding protein